MSRSSIAVGGLVFGMVLANGCAALIDSYHDHKPICDPAQLAKTATVLYRPETLYWISRGVSDDFKICVQTLNINNQDCLTLGQLRAQLDTWRSE